MINFKKKALWLSMFAAGVMLTGCNVSIDVNDDLDDDKQHVESAFQLQLLHFADIDGDTSTAIIENLPRFSALVNYFRDMHPENTLLLSSGDNWIPGPTYSASDDDSQASLDLLGIPAAGRADVLMLNALGVQASAFGNHEFDLGTGEIANLIGAEIQVDDSETDEVDESTYAYVGADFPYLSANIDFSTDDNLASYVVEDGMAPVANTIAASTVIMVDGEEVGVVGATTPTLGVISSPDDVTIYPMDFGGNPSDAEFIELAEVVQDSVDELTDMGINKIILLAHMQQLSIERELAMLLEDVDVIVGGGSNTYLADDTDRARAGDVASDTYPLQYMSAADEPVLVVNVDGDYNYLGRLVVDFDMYGVIIPDYLDEDVNGAYPADEMAMQEMSLSVDEDATESVVALSEHVASVLISRESNIFGNATVYLDGRRSQVRTQETNMGNLTADANLWQAQQFDATTTISIKNGGGIRDDIGSIVIPAGSNDPADVQFLPTQAIDAAGKAEGDISQFDIQNTLRFNNNLELITVTAAELVAIMEHAVSGVEPDSTPGSFPQVGGFDFSYDATAEVGARLVDLTVWDNNGAEADGVADMVLVNGELQGDATRTFRAVGLGYIVGGGDGYPFPSDNGTVVELDADQLFEGAATFEVTGTEQDALAEYLSTFYTSESFDMAETPADEDTRIVEINSMN